MISWSENEFDQECPKCNGHGHLYDLDEECSTCNGHGRIEKPIQKEKL